MSPSSTTITIPTIPPRALLISMAMRLDHSFGMDAWIQDQTGQRHPLCGGYTPDEREAKLADMAKLYEEVAGQGFFKWAKPNDPFYLSVMEPS